MGRLAKVFFLTKKVDALLKPLLSFLNRSAKLMWSSENQKGTDLFIDF